MLRAAVGLQLGCVPASRSDNRFTFPKWARVAGQCVPRSQCARVAIGSTSWRGARRAGERMPVMAQSGVVKFFNAEKGYGFIKPDDGGRDIFVHITAVEQAALGSLNEGQKISYDVEPDKKGKGPKAINLKVG